MNTDSVVLVGEVLPFPRFSLCPSPRFCFPLALSKSQEQIYRACPVKSAIGGYCTGVEFRCADLFNWGSTRYLARHSFSDGGCFIYAKDIFSNYIFLLKQFYFHPGVTAYKISTLGTN